MRSSDEVHQEITPDPPTAIRARQAAPDNADEVPGGSGARFRDLYPQLTESQLAEAEDNFVRYLEVVLRIYERVQTENETAPRGPALTRRRPGRYDSSRRSDPTPPADHS